MHDAICSNCGKRCQVPFRPTGEKPIFCNNCFGGANGRNIDQKKQERTHFGEKRMYQTVCGTCGKPCEVPFLPTGNRPVYCENCFSRGLHTTDVARTEPDHDYKASRPVTGSQHTESYKEQFVLLNKKLDMLIALLTPKDPIDSTTRVGQAKELPKKSVKFVKKAVKKSKRK